jgi:hypothetical protein
MMVARNMIFATLNPADKSSEITLSGGNLTATIAGPTSSCLVRSTVSKTSGKWYWEMTCNNITNYSYIGIGNASESVTTYLGSTNNGLAYTNDGYLIKNGGIASSAPGVYATSNVLGFALDVDAGTLELFVNNSSQGSYSANPTGALFAGVSASLGSPNIVVTANFGASAFTYTPPSGYNAGLYS